MTMKEKPTVQEALKLDPEKKTLIITVGNPFRKDDGIGPYLAELLSKRLPSKVLLLNVYDRPEKALDFVDKSIGKIIIIDAADFGGRPGEIRVISEEEIFAMTLSTHNLPIPILYKALAEESGSTVLFVGIQPVDVSFGEGLSPQVEKAASEIISYILEV